MSLANLNGNTNPLNSLTLKKPVLYLSQPLVFTFVANTGTTVESSQKVILFVKIGNMVTAYFPQGDYVPNFTAPSRLISLEAIPHHFLPAPGAGEYFQHNAVIVNNQSNIVPGSINIVSDPSNAGHGRIIISVGDDPNAPSFLNGSSYAGIEYNTCVSWVTLNDI